jgi:predicted dehydrogenase
MLESASEADCILGVGFNHRYFKGVQVVHDAVSSGEIGELLWLRAFAGHTGLSEFKAPWMYDKTAMGGGTLADNGVHVLDLVNYLLPDIESVTARTSHAFWKLDVEDNAFLHIASRTGVVCDFHSSWTEWKGYRFFVEAYGTRGMASMYYAPMRAAVRTIDSRGTPTATRRSFFVKDILREKASGWQSTVIETFVKELHDFRRRIDDTSLSVTAAAGADGLMARALADAAYLSSSTDSTIRVAEILVNTEIEMEPT